MRKQLKMNVSLRRKIHIMAFPQDTFLNARWSDDQSATKPSMPGSGLCFSTYLAPLITDVQNSMKLASDASAPSNSRPNTISQIKSRKCQ